MYNYGLIGNCQVSAIVHASGSIDWLSAPRPDSLPVFGKLLDPDGGEFSILPVGDGTFEQHYIPNTNILVTSVSTGDSAYTITDFCPRFELQGRMYRPISLFRIVEPTSGSPVIRVKCRPVNGWEKVPVQPIRGNSHLRFDFRNDYLRLLTNMSLTHLCEGLPLPLTEPLYFGLSWSSAVEEDIKRVTQDFLTRTLLYWQTWVKHCSIPALFQKETIRSALTLKLHCYEDTGAILAAMTTSLPEERGNSRNWDYRLCWLRDSYFTLTAFHRLGHFEEMEGFLKFLLNIVQTGDAIRPVYKVDGTVSLPETEHSNWTGFMDSWPVRSNNEAANHVQNDVFGEMILALAPIFFDERFHHLRTKEHERLLEKLGGKCRDSVSQKDAGLWELRNGWQDHSFTNLMCWAGLDRIVTLQNKGFFRNLSFDAKSARKLAEEATRSAIVDGSIRNGPEDKSFNAALLQAPILRFPDQALCEQTVKASYEALRFASEGDGRYFLYRYRRADDFGVPGSAFLLCSFWWVQALTRLGLIKEAREALDKVLESSNSIGLFSEHYLPEKKQQLGNFPQGYSHVGGINAAFAVSPSWDDVL